MINTKAIVYSNPAPLHTQTRDSKLQVLSDGSQLWPLLSISVTCLTFLAVATISNVELAVQEMHIIPIED